MSIIPQGDFKFKSNKKNDLVVMFMLFLEQKGYTFPNDKNEFLSLVLSGDFEAYSVEDGVIKIHGSLDTDYKNDTSPEVNILDFDIKLDIPTSLLKIEENKAIIRDAEIALRTCDPVNINQLTIVKIKSLTSEINFQNKHNKIL